MDRHIWGTPQLVLDEKAASQVWNWILTRQGLADSRRLSTAWEVADAALGLHAARLPSPYAIVASRTSDPSAASSLFTAPVRASLLTLRCMRKTLHTMPLALAAAAHVATLRFRERDALRGVRNAGYSAQAIDQVIDQVRVHLGQGPLSYRTIESALTADGSPIMAVRLAVKLAWERGMIAYLNTSGVWNREARSFTLTAPTYPALDFSLSRSRAVTTLVTAYFQRYGPATIRDATWWSGLSAAEVSRALLDSERQCMTVATPWSQEPCLMFADQISEALNSQAVTGVQLLAHEDTALKAYHRTRARYLGGLPQRRAFNQIGEALPTIIVDGLVAGTWSWDTRTHSVRTRMVPGKTTQTTRQRVRARAVALTEALRMGTTPSSGRKCDQVTGGTLVG